MLSFPMDKIACDFYVLFMLYSRYRYAHNKVEVNKILKFFLINLATLKVIPSASAQ